MDDRQRHGAMLRRHVEVDPNTDCWLWTAQADASGYGRVRVWDKDRKALRSWSAHRLAYEAWVGPIPDGAEVDHLCFTPRCINPEHLEAVTAPVNRRRAFEAGRGHSARNARKIHCKRGHLLAGPNLLVVRWRGYVRRGCRACRALREGRAA